MHKIVKILFFCMIFVAGAAKGQNIPFSNATALPGISLRPLASNTNKINGFGLPGKSEKRKLFVEKNIENAIPSQFTVSCFSLNADFYTRNFGFFCKKELQLEKTTGIPFRFRLGSLKYNDYLEGKPNTGIIPAY